MKTAVTLLAITVVILTLLLVEQVRERRDAERLLARSTSERSADVPAEDSGSEQSMALQSVLRSLREENRRLRQQSENDPADHPGPNEEKISDLKELLRRLPEQAIPELQLAAEADWYMAIDGELETVEDFRRALGRLRAAAEKRFAGRARPALAAFLAAHDNQFPKDVAQLSSYFEHPIDPAILRRYVVVPASEVKQVGVGGAWAITQRRLVDPRYDSRTVIGPDGYGSFTVRSEH